MNKLKVKTVWRICTKLYMEEVWWLIVRMQRKIRDYQKPETVCDKLKK